MPLYPALSRKTQMELQELENLLLRACGSLVTLFYHKYNGNIFLCLLKFRVGNQSDLMLQLFSMLPSILQFGLSLAAKLLDIYFSVIQIRIINSIASFSRLEMRNKGINIKPGRKIISIKIVYYLQYSLSCKQPKYCTNQY